MANSYKTISLKGTPVRKEGLSSEAIIPGHLVNYTSGGLFQKHNVEGGNAGKMFAIENETPGANVSGNAIAAAWASGDRVAVIQCNGSCVVNALVAAGADAIVKGDALESAGDGTVQKHAAPADLSSDPPAYDAIVGYAEESLDNSLAVVVARLAVAVA